MNVKQIIQTKSFDDLPRSAKKEIHLVSYREDMPPAVIGSYAYRIQKYPADIDLMDTVDHYQVHGQWELATDEAKLYKEFAKRVKEIVRNATSKNHYITDFKTGVDNRYLFTLGTMNKGVLEIDPEFYENVVVRAMKGMYNEEEFLKINALLKIANENGQHAYDGLTKILRGRYILRWKPEDVLKGKLVANGKTFDLEECLAMHQLVKMDAIALVDGNYMEVSNIWTFFIVSSDGKMIPLTPVPSVVNIPYDIEKIYWSDAFYNPFKLVKRVYSFARLMYIHGNKSYAYYIKLTADFIRGETSELYQIKSELEIIEMARLTGSKAMTQVDNVKNRLSNIISLGQVTVDSIGDLIDSFIESKDFEILEQAIKIIKSIINQRALVFLQKSKMNPPPLAVLPTRQSAEELTNKGEPANPFCPFQFQQTYNWSYVRYPDAPIPTQGDIMAAGLAPIEVSKQLRRIILSRAL